MTPEDLVRFWSKVERSPGCWRWTGSPSKGPCGGYGYFKVDGKRRRAHIVSYELLVGPVPKGLVLDHVAARGCTSKMCVNPAHLEPVTRAENARRAREARGRAGDLCVQGHPFDGLDSRGYRSCSICLRAASRRYKQRVRAARV